MRPAVLASLLLAGCLVELEADPIDLTDARAIVLPEPRDLGADAAQPMACHPVPAEVRSDGQPVGEQVIIAVPVGCGAGLDVVDVWLDNVTPPDALRLRELGPMPVSTIDVIYTPRQVGERVSGVLYVHTADAAYAVPIGASSRWTSAACRPWDVFAQGAELEERAFVRLDALPPPGVARTAATILWAVLEQPAGAESELIESIHFDDAEQDTPDDPTTPGAWYPLLRTGNYLFECTVKPPSGADCPAQVTRLRVQRCPCPDDLRVRIDWRTPDDRVTRDQLNLHLLHPAADTWGRANLDCHAGDLDPRWTTETSLERPIHAGDDPDTPGAEQISLPLAEGIDHLDGPYRIGAEVDTAIPLEATARIFLDDRMVWTTTRRIDPADRFWDIGAVGWYAADFVAVPFDEVTAEVLPDPWAARPAGSACLPGWSPGCAGECQVNEGAHLGRCR